MNSRRRLRVVQVLGSRFERDTLAPEPVGRGELAVIPSARPAMSACVVKMRPSFRRAQDRVVRMLGPIRENLRREERQLLLGGGQDVGMVREVVVEGGRAGLLRTDDEEPWASSDSRGLMREPAGGATLQSSLDSEVVAGCCWPSGRGRPGA
jgi:hypothetical protein